MASLCRFILKSKRSFESAVNLSNPANKGDGSPWECEVEQWRVTGLVTTDLVIVCAIGAQNPVKLMSK